ncbi:MAG: hypothetical protein U0992_14420 [Planctomycetaceae bacterium]
MADLAVTAGYDALCMRASQIGTRTPDAFAAQDRAALLHEPGLRVTMITGDFPVVYNNDAGPDCLRNIGPYPDLGANRLARR